MPGSFAHIGCDPSVPLRRPLSIMRANAGEGWLEFLYKPKGNGLEMLFERQAGEVLSVLAPIGRGFTPDPARPRLLALGGGVGIPPMIFLADQTPRAAHELRDARVDGLGGAVPVRADRLAARRSRACRRAATHSVALLERWGVPHGSRATPGLPAVIAVTSRISRAAGLRALPPAGRARRRSCSRAGRHRCSQAVAKLAREFDVLCQMRWWSSWRAASAAAPAAMCSLHTADGTAMKRVCVDGPVFDSREIYPA